MKGFFFWIMVFLWIGVHSALGCTSYMVTKGASSDGSSMVSYAGDSHIRYGQLYFRPRSQWPAGSMQTIYDRSSNKPLGQIPYPEETYQVIGFMNEFQLAIGESTFGGRSELNDTAGMIDWGSIMFLGLQRAKTAREAVKVMVELLSKYGYYSSGQSYSIGDPNEVWMLEIMPKGMDIREDQNGKKYNADKGVVWVARRIPDGYISAHANHARITQFPLADGRKSITSDDLDRIFDPEVEVVYAADVIDFARRKGYYEGEDAGFSFADAYAPLDFGAARFCELRVWAMFDQAAAGMNQYWDYATGMADGPRMPLYIKPDRKLSPRDLMHFKRNHLEGTPLDMTLDAGAGIQKVPYRWRPMTWEYGGKKYFNERTTATQQTAFSWIAQMRSWLPDPIGGIFWYGLDDANHSVHAPFYCGITHPPFSYSEQSGDILTYSDASAFWIFNRVSHISYLFYQRAITDIREKQHTLLDKYEAFIPAIDQAALALYHSDPALAAGFLTDFSHNTANSLLDEWKALGEFLLVKYLDGNIKQEKDGVFLRNPWGFPLSPSHPDHPDKWKEMLIEQSGDQFLIPGQ